MLKTKYQKFFFIQFIISIVLFGFSCLDISKESTFFYLYSFQKTILLLIQFIIVLFFLTTFIFNHTSIIQKLILILEKKVIKNNHQNLILTFTTYFVIALLIIQAFNQKLPIWGIYQKLFLLIINFLLIILHFLLITFHQSIIKNKNINKLIIFFNYVFILIYLYLSFIRYTEILNSITPLIFILLFLLLIQEYPLKLSKKNTLIAIIIFLMLIIPPIASFLLSSYQNLNHIILIKIINYFSLSILLTTYVIKIKNQPSITSINQTKFFKNIFFLIIFIITSINFYSNPLEIAHPIFFEEFQRGSDVLIIGKILNADQSTNPNTFMGVYVPPQMVEHDLEFEDVENNENIFFNQKTIENLSYKTYTAQIGIQGTFFLTLHNLFSNFTPTQQYALFELIMVAFMSLMLSLFSLWVLNEFGIIPASFTILSINLSPWLLTGARSVYWNFWIFFLPFICLLYYFKWSEKNNREKNWILYLLVFSTIILKSAMGFEYLSTILIMMALPWFYYAAKNKIPFKKFIFQLTKIILTSIASFATSVALLLWKITHSITHDFHASLTDLQNRVAMRTGVGNTTNLSPEFNQNILSTPLSEVLHTYLFKSRPLIFNLHAIHLLIILLILTILTLSLNKIKAMQSKRNALLLMTFISFLAPLSWLILAKSHSVVHVHINYILFSMPFSILLFTLLGFLADHLTDFISQKLVTSSIQNESHP